MKKPPQAMLNAATAVIKNAYAPYSHFHVATCVRSESGQLFFGCNVENASYSTTICAETSALGALFAAGFRKVTEALILVEHKKLCPPCGACRQRLSECANENTVIHLCNTNGDYAHYTLQQLLPHAFDQNNLRPS